jgi:hypothetical protein
MNANNMLMIEQGCDAKFRGFDRSMDEKLDPTVRMSRWVTPVFIATSLETAIKKAELYCTENPVEYNYRVKFR